MNKEDFDFYKERVSELESEKEELNKEIDNISNSILEKIIDKTIEALDFQYILNNELLPSEEISLKIMDEFTPVEGYDYLEENNIVHIAFGQLLNITEAEKFVIQHSSEYQHACDYLRGMTSVLCMRLSNKFSEIYDSEKVQNYLKNKNK